MNQWRENCDRGLEKENVGLGTALGFFCMTVEIQQK
jgi:hypothetical protein